MESATLLGLIFVLQVWLLLTEILRPMSGGWNVSFAVIISLAFTSIFVICLEAWIGLVVSWATFFSWIVMTLTAIGIHLLVVEVIFDVPALANDKTEAETHIHYYPATRIIPISLALVKVSTSEQLPTLRSMYSKVNRLFGSPIVPTASKDNTIVDYTDFIQNDSNLTAEANPTEPPPLPEQEKLGFIRGGLNENLAAHYYSYGDIENFSSSFLHGSSEENPSLQSSSSGSFSEKDDPGDLASALSDSGGSSCSFAASSRSLIPRLEILPNNSGRVTENRRRSSEIKGESKSKEPQTRLRGDSFIALDDGSMTSCRSLINLSQMEFKDIQLEQEYIMTKVGERVEFRLCYKLYFASMIVLGISELLGGILYQLGILWVCSAVARILFGLILSLMVMSKSFFKKFDLLASIYTGLLTVSYFVLRFGTKSYLPVHATASFAVWTFVIARLSLMTAAIHSGIYMFLVILSDIITKSLITTLYDFVITFGIMSFTFFAAYRLEFALRYKFLLNHQVEVSRRKQKEILNTMLPSFIVDLMLTRPLNSDGIPEGLNADTPGVVTVIFCDVYEFQKVVSSMEPTKLVELLDNLFLFFDKCAEQFQITKIETVFETYLSCAGFSTGSPPEPVQSALDAIEMSLAMLEVTSNTTYEGRSVISSNEYRNKMNRFSQQKHKIDELYDEDEELDPDDPGLGYGENDEIFTTKRLRVKVGIHTGEVTSGVVGAKKPQYALFGDTVNTASRMKMTGDPDYIHISDDTYELIKHDDSLTWQDRQLEVKGKGVMMTHLLLTATGTYYPNFHKTNEIAINRAYSLPPTSDDEVSEDQLAERISTPQLTRIDPKTAAFSEPRSSVKSPSVVPRRNMHRSSHAVANAVIELIHLRPEINICHRMKSYLSKIETDSAADLKSRTLEQIESNWKAKFVDFDWQLGTTAQISSDKSEEQIPLRSSITPRRRTLARSIIS